MLGKAYIFCRPSGAMGLGHVGGAFQLQDGRFRCFGTENPLGLPYVRWQDKGFWMIDLDEAHIVAEFAKTRYMMGKEITPYNFYKIKVQQNPNFAKAIETLAWCSQQDYQILSPAIVKSRTCEDDVCDTLSAYGLWMPWTYTYPEPNLWFGSMVDCPTYPV